ncbi:acyl carrier protein [Bacillus velezensis]|nr:acyl carrier protein [Bacillus velezensis]
MNQALKEDLDPSVLYEHPTIDAFAEWLVSNGQPPLAEREEPDTEILVPAPYKRFILNKSVMP